jgi:ABC-2 type transport system ATP-binding protein
LITLDGVAARRSPLALSNISVTWGPGVHALLGASADGGPLLLALIAGAIRPRVGRVRVLNAAATDAPVRPQVAFVPLEPALPGAMRVAEVFQIAAAIRGEPKPNVTDRLGALGLATLAGRAVGTLSREEARAVAVAEAITSMRVRVLLIEEPLLSLDARAVNRLPELLRERSRAGWTIVIATASVRDAAELADDCVLLRGGVVVGQSSCVDLFARSSAPSARLRIVTSDSRALAAALAREERVDAVARRDTSVTVRGRDLLELARAAARAIVASGVSLTELRVEPPSLEEARAGVGGMAAQIAEEQA